MQKIKKNLYHKATKTPKSLKQKGLVSMTNIVHQNLHLKFPHQVLAKIEEFINQKLYEKAVTNAELQLAESFKKIILTKQRVKKSQS